MAQSRARWKCPAPMEGLTIREVTPGRPYPGRRRQRQDAAERPPVGVVVVRVVVMLRFGIARGALAGKRGGVTNRRGSASPAAREDYFRTKTQSREGVGEPRGEAAFDFDGAVNSTLANVGRLRRPHALFVSLRLCAQEILARSACCRSEKGPQLSGTLNVPVTRPPCWPGARPPSTLETPVSRSIVRRPPLSVSPPRRSATPPVITITRRLRS